MGCGGTIDFLKFINRAKWCLWVNISGFKCYQNPEMEISQFAYNENPEGARISIQMKQMTLFL